MPRREVSQVDEPPSPIDGVLQKARHLLENGYDGVLGLRTRWGQVGPYLFTRPDELSELVLEPKYMLNELSRTLLSQMTGKRIAVAIRECDKRCLDQLDDRGALDLGKLTIIQITCDHEMAKRCNCLHPLSPIARVDKLLCMGCQSCIEACPYEAISMVDGKADADAGKCKGCGACLVACPTGAMGTEQHSHRDIMEDIANWRGAVH